MTPRSAVRLTLAAAIAFVCACHTQREQPAAPAPQAGDDARAAGPPAAIAMPFGLSCDRCQPFNREQCARAAAARLAAIVAEPELLDTSPSCAPDPPGPNFPSVCTATRLYRFGQVELLRAPAGASADDEFEAVTLYSEVYTSELEKWPGAGPVLQPGRRYVIFAEVDRKDMGWPADWYINLACELQQNG